MVALLTKPLRLTADNHDDRRIFPRKDSSARIEGERLDHSIPARQQPHLTLALRDLSMGGLSGGCDTPLAVGERLAVFFPPDGMQAGWDARGRVIRCTPSALGYRVAMEFDSIPMAA